MSDVIVGSLLILSGFALLIFARWLIDAINEDHAKKYSCTFNLETEEFETTNHKEERTMSEDTPEYIESNTNKKLRKQLSTMREALEFYADPGESTMDGGEVARAALESDDET